MFYIVNDIKPLKNGHDRRVVLNDNIVLVLPVEKLYEFRIEAEAELDGDRFRAAKAFSDEYQAWHYALGLLARRGYFAGELATRLLRKKIPKNAVDATIKKLANRRYLDDLGTARRFVGDLLQRKPMGVPAIKQELFKRQVPNDVIAAVTAELKDESDFAGMALTAGRKKLRGLTGKPLIERKRKLYEFLAQRGFDPATIRRTVAELVTGGDDDDLPPAD